MRRTLLLAALVAVPLLAVIGVAIAGSTASDDDASDGTAAPADGTGTGGDGPTTIPIGVPGAAPTDGGTVPGDGGTGGGASGDGTEGGGGGGGGGQADPAAEEIPSAPGVAGPEGDRPVTTYPQPTVPDGGCPRPSGAVRIALGERPDPGCVSVAAGQTIEFANRTGREISLVAESINEVVAPGTSFTVTAGAAFPEGRSTFWSPGLPALSGIVEVR